MLGAAVATRRQEGRRRRETEEERMPVDLPPLARRALDRQIADDDVNEVIAQAIGAVRLAIDKAVAHDHNADSYPLPSDARSLEQDPQRLRPASGPVDAC